ncbi:MAG: hypothetical protein QOE55_6227 [Acidobacteriaceae bacterium]|nr:hypothetical protein [Acidobacteriaceae bacterium]
MRFLRHSGIYRSDVSSLLVNLGRVLACVEIEEFTKDALRDSISRVIDADTDEETKTN